MKLSFLINLLKNHDDRNSSLSKLASRVLHREDARLVALRDFLKAATDKTPDRDLQPAECHALWKIANRWTPDGTAQFTLLGYLQEELSQELQSFHGRFVPGLLDSEQLFTFENYQALFNPPGGNLSVVDCLIQGKLISANNTASQNNFNAGLQLSNLAIDLLWTLLCAKPSTLLTQAYFDKVCELDAHQPFDLYRGIMRLDDGGNLNQGTLDHFLQNEHYVRAIARNQLVLEMQSGGYKLELGHEPKSNERIESDKLYLYVKNGSIQYVTKGRGFAVREDTDITRELGEQAAVVAKEIASGTLRPQTRQLLFDVTLQHDHRLFTGINSIVFNNLYLVFPEFVKKTLTQYFQALNKKDSKACATWLGKANTQGLSTLLFELPEYHKAVIEVDFTEIKPLFQLMTRMDADPFEVERPLRDLIHKVIGALDMKQLGLDKLIDPVKESGWSLPDLGIVRTLSSFPGLPSIGGFASFFQGVLGAATASPVVPGSAAEKKADGVTPKR